MGCSYFGMVGGALHHVLGQDNGLDSMADRRTRQKRSEPTTQTTSLTSSRGGVATRSRDSGGVFLPGWLQGLGYRDPTVTTEAVAKKVRRSADVLAVLADAPDIGFVKIIGQVEASLFQLHSAYDLFNDAMFAEFRSRGLQTQSATSLVENLELYDLLPRLRK